jgi:PQQ-like domain
MGPGHRLRRVACFLGWAAASVVLAPWGLASTHSPGPAGTPSWTVYHDDPAGSGVAVGVGSVDTAARAWTSPKLDGQLYGEPLVLGDRVYVATQDDTVYALSAATGAIAWSAQLGTPVRSSLLPCSNINPIVGITGTPVIDQARHEIFVVADELQNGRPAHVLVGLNTASGQVELSQDVDPPGQAPANILQRTGLTLDNGRVYFGYGGNAEDCGTYRGRLVSVPESGGTPRFFTVDARPGQSRGGMWMGGAAPAVSANGDLPAPGPQAQRLGTTAITPRLDKLLAGARSPGWSSLAWSQLAYSVGASGSSAGGAGRRTRREPGPRRLQPRHDHAAACQHEQNPEQAAPSPSLTATPSPSPTLSCKIYIPVVGVLH